MPFGSWDRSPEGLLSGLLARLRALGVLVAIAAIVFLVAAVPKLVARVRLGSRDIAVDQQTYFAKVAAGEAESVALLISAGIDPDSMDASRTTGLMQAATRNDLPMARALIDGGADLNYSGPLHIGIPFLSSEPPRPETVPLIIAAQAGHLDMVKLLLEHGAQKGRHNAEIALSAAVRAGHADVVEVLRAVGISTDQMRPWIKNARGPVPELRHAVAEGLTDVVRALLPGAAKIDEAGADDFRLLATAARLGHGAIVGLLLDAGADPNRLSVEELAAIVIAARSGHDAGARVLMERASIRDANVRSLLEAAVGGGGTGTRRILEDLGIPADEARDLALVAAAARGDLEDAVKSIEDGASLGTKDWSGTTALEHAALAGHVEVVRKLVEAGAPQGSMEGKHHRVAGGPDRPGYQEIRDLLQTAARPAGRPFSDRLAAIVKLPVDGMGGRARTLKQAQERADASAVSRLIDAACLDEPRAVFEALSRGANVNALDDRGISALARAVELGHFETAKGLITAGADANARGSTFGMTPLMFAARRGRLDLIHLLVARGADLNAVDFRELTPLRFARDWKELQDRVSDRLRYASMISWMVEHGARDR